jgi:glycosyltransferase involved in cell wall biosynthesis
VAHLTPLVSVIIPCKNGEPYVAAAIESCLAQTWPRVEIIVVDNGSSDRSWSIAKSYSHKGVRTIVCDRAGASAARNVGISESLGEYIQFLDADDVLERRKICSQLTRLSKETRDTTAICKWGAFLGNLDDVLVEDSAIFDDYEPADFLVQLWSSRTMMAPFAWLASREVVDQAGRWSEDLTLDDDGEFFARVVLASRKIVCCEDVLGFYRQYRPGVVSLSRRRDSAALRSAFAACEKATAALLCHEDSVRTRLASAARYLYFVHIAYPSVPELVREAERRIRLLGAVVEPPKGSAKYSAASKLVGWKLARRMQGAWLKSKARMALDKRA